MYPTVRVRSSNAVVKKQREETAKAVVDYLSNRLPERGVLCVLGDKDWQALRDEAGAAHRGIYMASRLR